MVENILVTGGTGFVGSFVVESLLTKGHRVIALARNRQNLKWLDGVNGVEILEGDVENLPSIPADITRVAHLAGVTKESSLDAFIKGNVTATNILLANLRNSGISLKRFLFVSSQAACGPSVGETIRSEEDVSTPLTWYGKSKLQAEQLVWENEKYFPFTIIRPPSVYGPRDRDIFQVFRMLQMGLNIRIGHEEQMVSMIYVKNLASGIVSALFHPAAKNQLLFLADEENVRFNEVIEILASIMNKKYITFSVPFSLAWGIAFFLEKIAALTGNKTILNRQKMLEVRERNWLISAQKAKKIIQYQPEYSLQQGLRETYAWYRAMGWL